MTRGFHHPAETFSKNYLHAARSCLMPLKTSRLWPPADSAEALKKLSFGPPREGVPTLPESLETTFNTLSLNILYLHISNLFLTFAA